MEGFQGSDVVTGLQPDVIIGQLVVICIVYKNAVCQGQIVRPGQLQVGCCPAPIIKIHHGEGPVGGVAVHKSPVNQVALPTLRSKAGFARLEDGQHPFLLCVGVQHRADDAPIGIQHLPLHTIESRGGVVVIELARHGGVCLRHFPHQFRVQNVYIRELAGVCGLKDPIHIFIVLAFFNVVEIPGHLKRLQPGDVVGGDPGGNVSHAAGCVRKSESVRLPLNTILIHGRQVGHHHHTVVLIGNGSLPPLVAGQGGQGLGGSLPQRNPVYIGHGCPIQSLSRLAGLVVRFVRLRVVIPHIFH